VGLHNFYINGLLPIIELTADGASSPISDSPISFVFLICAVLRPRATVINRS
jgi:hypothetical protein